MKIKRIYIAAIAAAAVLALGVTAAFAATADDVRDDAASAAVCPGTCGICSASGCGGTWTSCEEHAAWIEQEIDRLQSMVGEKGWTRCLGEFTWTQELVDETVAHYREILERVGNGAGICAAGEGAQAADTVPVRNGWGHGGGHHGGRQHGHGCAGAGCGW